MTTEDSPRPSGCICDVGEWGFNPGGEIGMICDTYRGDPNFLDEDRCLECDHRKQCHVNRDALEEKKRGNN